MSDARITALARLDDLEAMARAMLVQIERTRIDLVVPAERLLTPSEASFEFDVSERTILNWATRFPNAATKRGGRWLISLTRMRDAVSVFSVSDG